jgi:hypothetical protein
MSPASLRGRHSARFQKVDANYFIRVLNTVRQAAARFNDFVLQPDEFQQINVDLAVGAAVLVLRGDSTVFDALVRATAHGYMLAEGWKWQSSRNSSCQQAVMLLSRLSFCITVCASYSIHGDTMGQSTLSDSDKVLLGTKLSHLVAETGKEAQLMPSLSTYACTQM